MRSSERLRRHALVGIALAAAAGLGGRAQAQAAQGFAVERFYPSPAGGGWFVMDELDLHGGFGGALSLTTGYAHDPLDPTNAAGTQRLNIVADEAFVNLAAAVTYDRFRLSLDLSSPVAITGNSGTLGSYAFTAPTVTLGNNPDTISDARVGFDARLFGEPGGVFRLGGSAQLYIPSGARAEYDSDGTLRGMLRVLAAGDVGPYRYAAQLGVHLRPLDDAPTPGSPAGSELLFGVAGGRRFGVLEGFDLIVGPEIFGETALRSFFGGPTTGLEALLTGRFEGTGEGKQLRVKVGAGAGLDPQFGTPEWRVLLSAELFERHR